MTENARFDALDAKLHTGFSKLVEFAQAQHISDIHIEPFQNTYRIRLRRDGLLHHYDNLEKALGKRLVNFIKTEAKLDITETRKPQDGRLQIKLSEKMVDIRVSSCPTIQQEKLVLRLLQSSRLTLDIATLGMDEKQAACFIKHIHSSEGLILICGPTGSGKTVTLYSALQTLNTIENNIVSIEDPVEIKIEGVNQVPTQSQIDLDFSKILRSTLRQDPDIIMLGEIRDAETANITLKASQTGHLVLSSLHCHRAIDAFNRLKHLGVEPYDIAHNLKLIVSQRLVRLLCTICQGKGCDKCHQGFQGRTGIFELIEVNNALREALVRKKTIKDSDCHTIGTLESAAKQLIEQSRTTEAELCRVL
ncbi:MAG: protein transporter HofB [Gammaproteobacteria bacterium CG11_big_fil_rev_8_21_14_0_20_46_22]|nr:MAG: protein transporter HofB [Gammaproteobacteria bacterium CG12_big_fil_rev_8_21_14_0_65_46_12]PIR11244.1 MAG: protein transporter HofB [Gammaproteobacteria bacterium CG11_big_fil_rev_8_21_14_0_20_46_22]